MHVLLTGGTGFIGSHTAVELIAAGHSVVIADNLANSSASVVDRIEQITGTRPKFYQIDVADTAALSRLFDENELDAVGHFAGAEGRGRIGRQATAYYRNNLDSTLALIEAHGVTLMQEFRVCFKNVLLQNRDNHVI